MRKSMAAAGLGMLLLLVLDDMALVHHQRLLLTADLETNRAQANMQQ